MSASTNFVLDKRNFTLIIAGFLTCVLGFNLKNLATANHVRYYVVMVIKKLHLGVNYSQQEQVILNLLAALLMDV